MRFFKQNFVIRVVTLDLLFDANREVYNSENLQSLRNTYMDIQGDIFLYVSFQNFAKVT